MMNAHFYNALSFAIKSHSGQKRKVTGEDYIQHPLRVAKLISTLSDDIDLQIASLLHDTIEDCGVTLKSLNEMFGPRVSSLVIELTNIKNYKEIYTNKTEYMLIKFASLSDDALLIKLADRLDNMLDRPSESMVQTTIKVLKLDRFQNSNKQINVLVNMIKQRLLELDTLELNEENIYDQNYTKSIT